MDYFRMELKVLDLFSGIGGFSLGLENTGHFKTIAFCEKDKYCQKVLNKHWPNVKIYKDIINEHFEGLQPDIITGGYPCQPFSVAGSRKGDKDHRHLWPEMFRVIKQKRPSFVIAENVVGHITMGLDQVLFDLESEGYAARAFIIPACAIDAPQRRDRLWIIANSISEGIRAHARIKPHPKEERTKLQQKNGETLPDDVDTICATMANPAGGYADWQPWPVEPAVGRVADGIPGRVDRIRALGNAVVPGVVTKIGLSIIEQLKNKEN